MAKSKGLGGFGRGSSGRPAGNRFGRGGSVTVIEDRVSRSYARTAKVAFYVITAVVGLLSATVAASWWHPIIALAAGLAAGLVVAAPVAAFIAAWPVIRVIWWWTPEIIAAGLVVYGFVLLAGHTSLIVRILTVAILAGVPAAIPMVRRKVVALAWCLISRHRLRACFNEFIISNRSGSLPLVLWATPTPVGERVWIWLRPGLSLDDLQARLDKIAVACWASTITVERASTKNAALVRIDVKRRDALTSTVDSPLVDLVDPDVPAAPKTASQTAPTALDLPDIPASAVGPDTLPRIKKRADKRADTRADNKPVSDPAASRESSNAEDVLDWV